MNSLAPISSPTIDTCKMYVEMCKPEQHRFATIVITLLILIALAQISKAFWHH